ncbi:MAG: helicase-exonuclease AddAB subunit AddA [Eubacterium sp.]|nr:helicase-exonuclease AddAB subunit AddA [Eubacterium sp.]
MARVWNKNQERVFNWRTANLLVSAAAGSGKTAALVERIIKTVVDDKVDVDRLIVVTFTRAAAGEMKERVSNEFHRIIDEETKKKEPDMDFIERIERQVTLLNNARICTIDSFCQYLINNYFYAVPGLDPGFRVADEDETKVLLSDTVDNILLRYYTMYKENPENEFSRRFAELSDFLSGWKNDENLKGVLIRLYGNYVTRPIPEAWLSEILEAYDPTSERVSVWTRDAAYIVCGNVKDCIQIAKYALSVLDGEPELSYWRDTIKNDIEKMEKLIIFDEGETIDNGYKPTLDEVYANFSRFYDDGGFDRFPTKRLKDDYLKEIKEKAKRARDLYSGSKAIIYGLWSDYLNTDNMRDMLKSICSGRGEEYQETEGIEGYIVDTIIELRPYVETNLQMIRDIEEEFSAAKREFRIVDFGDLEHMALHILTSETEYGTLEPTEIAKMLRDHYYEIMIDEYQDSNLLQESILTSITGEGTTIFMVGDVKQSIYSFRNAVPGLFIKKQQYFDDEESFVKLSDGERAGNNICINLDRNYRSRKNVLSTVNEVFTGLMTRDFGGVEYDERASLKYGGLYDDVDKKEPAGFEYNTELMLIDINKGMEMIPKDEKGKNIRLKMESENLGVAELQAYAIGEKIMEMVHGEKPLLVKDRDSKGNEIKRPVRYSDIAILQRANAADTICKALSEMDIPTETEIRSGYFECTEVMTVLNFLRIIDNPMQDIPLVSVMHSAFFDFDDKELAIIRTRGGKKETFYQRLKEFYETSADDSSYSVLIGKVRRFLTDLTCLRKQTSYRNLYDLIYGLYTKYDYYDIAASLEDGEKRKANLDMLLLKARGFAEKGKNSPSEFIHFIENMKKQELDYGEAMTHAEDAVKVMTIHKSKGLEFPVVFLFRTEKGFNMRDSYGDIIVEGDEGLGLSLFDNVSRVKSRWTFQKHIARGIVNTCREEEQRVLYVALTRAMEKLIIVGAKRILLSEPKENEDPVEVLSTSYRKKWTDTIEESSMRNEIGIPLYTSKTYLGWLLKAFAVHKSLEMAVNLFVDSVEAKINALYKEEEYVTPYVHLKEEKENGLDVTVISYEHIIDFKQSLEKADKTDEDLPDKEETGTGDICPEYIYPFANTAGYPAKVSVSWLKAKERENAPEGYLTGRPAKNNPEGYLTARSADTGNVSASELGTAYHKFMEKLNPESFAEYTDKLKVEEFLDELTQRGFFTDEVRKALSVDKIASFVADLSMDSIILRMAAAKKRGMLWKEQPFMKEYLSKDLPLGIDDAAGNDDHTTLVQGVIDAYFIDEDGEAVIIDYKTDGMMSGRKAGLAGILKERYKVQFDFYTEAVESLEDVKVKERYICSLSLGKFIPV